MTTDRATTPTPVDEDPTVYLLENVSWQTYELLLRDRDGAGEHFRITYDRGRMQIDRRGSEIGRLDGISWETYEHLVNDLEQQHLRLTFDRGRLGVMAPTRRRERIKSLIGRMVEAMALELRIPATGFGSATWRLAEGMRGIEADESYYVQSEPFIRGKDDIDLSVDPPPDLVVEVEIAHPPVARLPVYAGLGVPEVWIYRAGTITANTLQGGAYVPTETSAAFSGFRPAELDCFVAMLDTTDDTTIVTSFLDWLRTVPRP
jgi:Uma2 family endonuclease